LKQTAKVTSARSSITITSWLQQRSSSAETSFTAATWASEKAAMTKTRWKRNSMSKVQPTKTMATISPNVWH